MHILAAYNKENGQTGATGLSLGGGAFFTSMEDQTLDAIGGVGEAWIIGAGFHLSTFGIDGLDAGVAYGEFKAEDTSLYSTNEIDTIMDYKYNNAFSVSVAFALIDLKTDSTKDYSQFRIISNYNF